MEWTRERVSELTRLWEDGLKVVEIAHALGLTPGQVVGKAHRLQIKGLLSRRPHRAKRELLPVEELKRRRLERERRYVAQNREKYRLLNKNYRERLKTGLPTPVVLDPKRTCLNIVSGIGRHAQMCGKPSVLGKSWCPACHTVLVLPPKYREAA